jgi:hypothetical protein
MNVYKSPEPSIELRGVLVDEKGSWSVISSLFVCEKRTASTAVALGEPAERHSSFRFHFFHGGKPPSSLRSIDVTGARAQLLTSTGSDCQQWHCGSQGDPISAKMGLRNLRRRASGQIHSDGYTRRFGSKRGLHSNGRSLRGGTRRNKQQQLRKCGIDCGYRRANGCTCSLGWMVGLNEFPRRRN